MNSIRPLGAFLVALVAGLGCGGGAGEVPPAAAPPVAAPEPTPAPSAAPEPARDPVEAAVEAARPAMRACYEKARRANAALGRTTVSLKLRADDTGRVTNVDIDYAHKFDEESKACMREAAFSVKLPAAPSRTVKVPMTFDAT